MKIRNILSVTILTLALGVSTSSCNDFLDVHPSGEKVEGDLFDTSKGFEEAIYGVYGSMASTSLYGMNLLWGLTDVMAQDLGSNSTAMNALKKYDYDNQYVRDLFSGVWTSAYKTIGYANNVIKNLNETSLSLQYHDAYLGEMLAVRALLHFEMLRMFAPLTPGATAIPYVETWDFSVKPFLTVAQVTAKIEADLLEAERLLAPVDEPLMTYPRDDTQYNAFMNWRETHMNVWAVRALLARLYFYTGSNDKAATYASKVIGSNVFPLADQTEIRGFIAGIISPKETIFGIYAPKYLDTARSYLYSYASYQSYIPYDNVTGATYDYPWQSVFNEDMTDTNQDARVAWFNQGQTLTKLFKLVDYATIENNGESQHSEISGINVMRISELYLIAAECYLESDPDKALGYFNAEITSRGLTPLNPGKGEELTLDRIYNEFHKELFGEGQQWYNMKRLNKDFISNAESRTIAASDQIYVVPVPADEYEYRP
ncbi:MAG: RagB/SusD family nutrient uptake outer membrane protein [Duncaniella sp.]|nr:RagB/SusD family nutrient uptake outer membrane protein [Duncaniella sp.]